MTLVNGAADAAQNTVPPSIERKGTAITRSLDVFSVAIVIVIVALGLI